MSSFTLAQVFGDRDVYPHQAISLISGWFSPMDIVVISGKEPPMHQTGLRPRLQSVRITAKKFVEELQGDGGTHKLASLCADTDLYFAISPVKTGSDGPRLKKADIVYIPGISIDLDVKDGGFSSNEAVYDFLRSLVYTPSFTVNTGSGGVHAYWKFTEAVPLERGEELIRAWWAYVNEIAQANYNADIDRLIDATRMMRVPGTLRYPKTEEELVTSVTLTHSSEIQYTPEQIAEVTSEAVQRRNAYIESIRTHNREITDSADINIAGMDTDNLWYEAAVMVQAEKWVTDLPWESILSPLGWTYLRTDYEGRDLWARPGSADKSATVNWPERPFIMALHSTSPETGLSDLQEAHVSLTKWRVILRLYFADDQDQMYEWIRSNLVLTPTSESGTV